MSDPARLFAALEADAQLRIIQDAAEAIETEAHAAIIDHRSRAELLERLLETEPNSLPPRRLEPASNGTPPAAAEPDVHADDEDAEQPEPAAASPPPEGEPPSEPPAPAPDDSPPEPEPPAHNRPYTQEDLERQARVMLDERRATPSGIATAMARRRARDEDRTFSGGASQGLIDRAREYLAELEQLGKVEEAGRVGRGVAYGWRDQESAQEPAGALPDPRPGLALSGRSEPAGGAEDALVTVQREIRQALGHGPARIPDIARQHDRPPAQVAQAMELLKREGAVEKTKGGTYIRTDQPDEEWE